MDRFLLFFFRLVVMAAGFFVACVATGAALALLTDIITPQDVRSLGSNETLPGVLISVFAVASIIAYAALVPATFVIIFAEMRRRRGWLYYCLSGGGIAVLCLSFVLMNPQQEAGPSVQFFAITVASGMLGGIAYWAIAGRHAGGWLPRQIKRSRLERAGSEE